jgi:pimeloyl-ACP methyl ester carboxylesterase
MQITARGLTFEVSVAGPEAGASVVLLHGFPQHSGEWDGVAPILHDAGLRTVAVDQRGYSPGARPPAVADYRIAECALDVVSIVDKLGLDRVHLVGHDWGAAVAWYVAIKHAERLRTLTAISVPHPLAMARAYGADPDQRERSRYIHLFRRAGRAEEVMLADDARRLRGMFADSGMSESEIDRFVAPMRAPGALTSALNWYRAMRMRHLIGLDAVTVPTTMVWSDNDLAIGPTAVRLCAKYVAADYRFVVLPGITHWVPDQAPDAVAAAIIERVAAASPVR